MKVQRVISKLGMLGWRAQEKEDGEDKAEDVAEVGDGGGEEEGREEVEEEREEEELKVWVAMLLRMV